MRFIKLLILKVLVCGASLYSIIAYNEDGHLELMIFTLAMGLAIIAMSRDVGVALYYAGGIGIAISSMVYDYSEFWGGFSLACVGMIIIIRLVMIISEKESKRFEEGEV